MRDISLQSPLGVPRDLVARQHGVVTRTQLLELGFTAKVVAKRHRSGRLHRMHPGVYAVGRPQLDACGRWLAAVLACGPRARLSHTSGGQLWEMLPFLELAPIHVSVPLGVLRRVPGLTVHRRAVELADGPSRHEIPLTEPVSTLIDLATMLTPRRLETAINEADKRGVVSPEQVRSALGSTAPRPGVLALRRVLDAHTFTLTDSELERLFLPITRAAGLSLPDTRRVVNGFKVDFFWPALGLVVETDGLRYHRTPAAQARDRLRDQAHTAAGLTALRFTHAQVAYDAQYVTNTLRAVAGRLTEALYP